MSRRVVVGVGNTSVQFAQFTDSVQQVPDTLESVASEAGEKRPASVPTPDWHFSVPCDTDFEAFECPHSIDPECEWLVASVNRHAATDVERWARARYRPTGYRYLAREDFAIALSVEQPERVGQDRVAAAVAVEQLRMPGESALFVDAGTAITVNAIDAQGAFIGGAIFPGTLIASRALHAWTDQLPQVKVDWRRESTAPTAIGNATEKALESGIYWSAVGAVRELTTRMAAQLGDDPPIYITGGFGQHLAEHINNAIHVPHLVVAGIALSG